ncbi:MAG: diaminobutyrate--2-oxoglutarate transaminase [Alphaproteobacteria bacterium]
MIQSDKFESAVRSYCRGFPAVFARARGARLWDTEGREYIDFFAGAGALNYGHNPPEMKERLVEYLQGDGVVHGLDMATAAKERLLERFHSVILEPRGMPHKILFPGPTGTNAVEAAIKLARLVTGRTSIMTFTNAFHGMTLGSLALTGNATKRAGAGVSLGDVTRMPYDGYLGPDVDTLDYVERCLDDAGSGVDVPAAAIVETVQAEGGLKAASDSWLRRLAEICQSHGILLIVDDIQVGCGRTGPFFSFESAGIDPDIVCLSKSVGGFGLPLALVLVKPEYDRFEPGQHNGTFRGNNLAFVTACEALKYWGTDAFSKSIRAKADIVTAFLNDLVRQVPELGSPEQRVEVRGRGLLQGVAVAEDGLAEDICRAAFRRGLIMETSGPRSEVFKILPPLVIDEDRLKKGLGIIRRAVGDALAKRGAAAGAASQVA